MNVMRLCLLTLFAALAFAQDPAAITPYQVFTRNASSGLTTPCSGCSIYTYLAGTTTPRPVYTDSTLMTQNTNPVPTNSDGYVVNGNSPSTITGIWVGTTCYKFVLKDANNVTKWTQDQICDAAQVFKVLLAGSTGAGLVGFSQTAGYSAGTVGIHLQQGGINVKDAPYNAKCDGSTDDTTAINGAIQRAISTSSSIYIPPGTCLVNTATGGIILNFLSSTGGSIIGAGSSQTIIKTTTASADLMAAVSSVFSNPVYNISGIRFVGPDYNGGVSICPTTTSGNGLRISGTAGARVNMTDVVVYGFCGSTKAGIWLDNVEDATLIAIESQFNDYGLRLTTAFNGNSFAGALISQNATRAISCEDCQNNTFDGLVVQSNKKTGLFMTHSSGNVFNGCHFENNNTTATAGIFGTDLRGTSGNFVLGNQFIGCAYNGNAHENIGLTGVSGGSVTSSNHWIGGISSSAANPFVVSSGAFGSATFDSLTSKIAATDPQFVITFLNDTADGLNYYPNGAFTGYVTPGMATVSGPTSFTPTLKFGGGSTGMTYTTQTGFYTTTNGVTHATIAITLSAKGSSTGNATIGGLPASTHGGGGNIVFFSGGSSLTVPLVYVAGSGATSITLAQQAASVDTALTESNFTDTSSLLVSVDYN